MSALAKDRESGRLPRIVSDIMTAPALMLDIDDRLDVASLILEQAKIRHLPIVRDGQLRGVLSLGDVLAHADGDPAARNTTRCHQVMTAHPLTARPGDDVIETGRRMLRESVSCLPILNGPDGVSVVGIVTITDFDRVGMALLERQALVDREPPRVATLMTSGALVTTRAEQTLDVAYAMMVSGHVHHLPVVDARERLIGVVSDHDLLRAGPERASLTVGERMTREVVTAPADGAAGEAARLFEECRIGALPVVRAGRLVGMFTETDLLAHVVSTWPLSA